jgi:hypothetical protein
MINKQKSKRKYQLEFMEYGFTTSKKDESIPLCLICNKSLSNEAMAPSKLKRHFETNHSEYKNKSREFFEGLLKNYLCQAKI